MEWLKYIMFSLTVLRLSALLVCLSLSLSLSLSVCVCVFYRLCYGSVNRWLNCRRVITINCTSVNPELVRENVCNILRAMRPIGRR